MCLKTKLTPDDIEELVDIYAFVQPSGSTLTTCILTLTNGCTLIGSSNVIDPKNYDAELGKSIALRNAKDKIWEAEGYALKRDAKVLVERAARTAHEVNRLYCESVGDDSQPLWEDAPDWQKESARLGVKAIIENPNQTPEQSHESWLAAKEADGWVYGSVKNPTLKQHPCMVPYDELSPTHRWKDYLFTTTVKSVLL